jgi:hypothetical protein
MPSLMFKKESPMSEVVDMEPLGIKMSDSSEKSFFAIYIS